MPKQTVTLYIDDTSLRLVVAQGKEIKEFAEAALEPGSIDNNTIVKEAEVAFVMKRLCEEHKVAGARVRLAISGFRCMTRPISFPKLPKEMLAEAVTREAQRTLPVPIEELYLSWQVIPSSAEQMQVFFVGIPRKTTDALFRTLRQAGLKAGFMELKPLLLTRAVKEVEAIIIDTQASEFDIVVMADGIPKVRTVQFANASLSKEEKLTAVKNELIRSLTFYNTNNPEKPFADTVPAFVSGDLAAEVELHQPLSQDIGRPVLMLQSPLPIPEGSSPGHYMTNICLALPAPSQKKGASASVANLNTIPAVYQTRAVSLGNVIMLPGAVAAAGSLAFLMLFGQSLSSDITSIKTQIAKTNQQLQQKQSQQQELTTKVAELEKSIGVVTASRDSLTTVIDILATQAQATGNDLAVALNSVPQSLTLTSIRHVGNVLTIIGNAQLEKQILSYVEKLDATGQFGSLVLTDMMRDSEKDGEIIFTVVGTLQTKGIGASSIEVALGSLPPSVNLTAFTSDGGSLIVEGTAPNADRVFAYLRSLEASNAFQLITITNISRINDESTTFSLVLKTGE